VTPVGFQDKVAFVWKVADKLRGTFKQHEYGSVMLPLLVLRRMDAVLAPTKAGGPRRRQGHAGGPGQRPCSRRAGHRFYNTSPLTFASLLADDKNLADNLRTYIRSSPLRRMRSWRPTTFDPKIERMDRAGILYAVLADFADLDLRPPS
jgi:type I restriction enzyme M protein